MSATAPSTTAISSSSNRPPVTLSQTSHLDPGAYIRGTHPITFGEHNLIHPRVLLTTITQPLQIGSNNIISEKAIIGSSPSAATNTSTTTSANTVGPNSISSLDPSSSSLPLNSPSLSGPSTPQLHPTISPNSSTSHFTLPTTLHSHIHIHPSAQIHHSTTIHSYTTIESHATIHPGVTIGAHSKICANVTVTADVPEWTVVHGNGNLRRSRRPPPRPQLPKEHSASDNASQPEGQEGEERRERERENGRTEMWKRIEDAENLRVKGMDREREATSIILRNAARAAVAAKRQSLQR